MNSFYNWISNQFDFSKATLSGCLDVIVVKREDGTYRSTPFHLRFGRKFKDQKNQTNEVTIYINGQQVPFKMKVDDKGIAYFEEHRPRKNTQDEINQQSSQQIDEQKSQIQQLSTQPANSNQNDNYTMDFMSQSEDDGELVQQFSSNQKAQSSEDIEINNTNNDQRWRYGEAPQYKPRENDILSAKQFQEEYEKNKGFLLSPKNQKEKSGQIQQDQNQSQKNNNNQFWNILGFLNKKNQSQQNLEKSSSQNNIKNSNLASPRSDYSTNLIIQESDIFGQEYIEQSPNQNQEIKEDIQQQEKKDLKAPENQGTQSVVININNQIPQQDYKQVTLEQSQQNASSINQNIQTEKQQVLQKNSNKQNLQIQSDKDALNQQKGNQSQTLYHPVQGQNQNIQSPKENKQIFQENQQQYDLQEEEAFFNVEMSLCADLLNDKNEDKLIEIFDKKKVTFDQFKENPQGILEDKNLLVKIRDQLYPWSLASMILISEAAFSQDLPEKYKKQFLEQMNKLKTNNKIWSGLWGIFGGIKSNNENEQKKSSQQNNQAQNQSKANNKAKEIQKTEIQKVNEKKTFKEEESQNNNAVQNNNNLNKNQLNSLLTDGNQKIRKSSDDSIQNSDASSQKNQNKLIKVYKPNQQILESFNLKIGANEVKYVLHTKKKAQDDKNKTKSAQEEDKNNKNLKNEKNNNEQDQDQYLRAQIFLWPDNAQVVISDIDGTITQSDIMGQLAPMVGQDWNHKGVASLYQNIAKNGYQILYLTARAIGQSEQTRNFLNEMHQENTLLPNGPVLMSPDGLVKSFSREVIYKRPEEFKTRAINDVRFLFTSGLNLYAGFGNKDTDATAYQNCGVPKGKIFIINPEGYIYSVLNNSYKTTYKELNQQCDLIFPPLNPTEQPKSDDFNDSNFWKFNQHHEYDIQELQKDIFQ